MRGGRQPAGGRAESGVVLAVTPVPRGAYGLRATAP